MTSAPKSDPTFRTVEDFLESAFVEFDGQKNKPANMLVLERGGMIWHKTSSWGPRENKKSVWAYPVVKGRKKISSFTAQAHSGPLFDLEDLVF